MPDVVDAAQAREEVDRDDALRAARLAGPPAGAASLKECIDCGDKIPQSRREAVRGVTTCVECQIKRERRGR